MELIPMLDASCAPTPGVWYLIAAEGDGPSPRVGHASLVCQCSKTDDVKVGTEKKETNPYSRMIIVGGATPSGPFNDVYYLDFYEHVQKWCKIDSKGLISRYEHGIVENNNGDILVFGGAEREHNLDSIQTLKRGETKWQNLTSNGCTPSPRTCVNVATIDKKMFVFGGGLEGARPVTDTHMHIFDSDTCSWTQPECTGILPTPRHGHLMVACCGKIYIHGGMAEGDLHNDLFVFDTELSKWDEIKQSGDVPSARAAHAGVAVFNFVYIFGGMNFLGALDDMYKFDTDFLVWSKIKIEGSRPPPRLDHTLACVDYHTKKEGGAENSELKKEKLLLVFGGMDTHGQIFDDTLAILAS